MIARVVRAWNAYWFRPAPVLDLAVFRVMAAAGQLLLYVVLWRPLDGEFLRIAEIPHMYEPLAAVRFFLKPVGSDWLPTLAFVSVVYYVTVAALVFAVIGLFTRTALALAAAGSVFTQAYAYSFGDFHHPEAIMAIALVVLAFSPSGNALSLDNWRRRRERPDWAPETTDTFAGWPRLVMLWMFSLIYLSAAYYKVEAGGHDWMNGYTLRYYLLQDGLRWDKPLGVWMAGRHWLAVAFSIGAVAFEALFFLVLFFPGLFRIFWPAGFGMHVGILLLMSAGFWEYLILYLAILPWTTILAWAQARAAIPRRPAPAQ